MKLQDQFTTIEQSKKLVELGINPDLAKFWHVELEHMIKNKENDEITYEKELRICSVLDRGYLLGTHIAPAFSMAEVLFMLNHYWDDIDMSEGIYEQANLLIHKIIESSCFDTIKYINEELQD